jgi:hypothetical protein
MPREMTTKPVDKVPTERSKKIPQRVRLAIEKMVNGEVKTVTAAAEAAGLSREYLSRSLSAPPIAAYLKGKIQRRLAVGAARAGAVKMELLESASDHVRNDASEYVLALAGIKPAEKSAIEINLSVKAGYIIDLSPEPGELVDVTPTRSEHSGRSA